MLNSRLRDEKPKNGCEGTAEFWGSGGKQKLWYMLLMGPVLEDEDMANGCVIGTPNTPIGVTCEFGKTTELDGSSAGDWKKLMWEITEMCRSNTLISRGV